MERHTVTDAQEARYGSVEAARAVSRDNWRKRQAKHRAQGTWKHESRRKHLWATYRLTPEDFDRMVQEQSGLCAICRHPPKKSRYGVLDVDHLPGSDPVIVRGLLCHQCNLAIGLLRDDPSVALSASEYLMETWKGMTP